MCLPGASLKLPPLRCLPFSDLPLRRGPFVKGCPQPQIERFLGLAPLFTTPGLRRLTGRIFSMSRGSRNFPEEAARGDLGPKPTRTQERVREGTSPSHVVAVVQGRTQCRGLSAPCARRTRAVCASAKSLDTLLQHCFCVKRYAWRRGGEGRWQWKAWRK